MPDLTETLKEVNDKLDTLQEENTKLAKQIEEKSATPRFGRAPGVIIGESPNGSRAFSMGRLAKGLALQATGQSTSEDCKLEMQFSQKLAKAYSDADAGVSMRCTIPVSADYLNAEKSTAIGEALAKEWAEMSAESQKELDMDEYAYFCKKALGKDLTFGTATTGGSFVAPPAQGEMIDLYRAKSLFGQDGISATEVPLPQQGSIQYPRVTGGTTITGYAEGDSSTESTPTTGLVSLTAKGYTGLVEFTEQFMKFASMGSADAFIRNALTLDTALQVDRDIIYGPGGNRIQGIVRTSGITTATAATTGANGNTLSQKDIELLLAQMKDANVPIDSGAFIAMTNKLWTSLKYREDTAGNYTSQATYAAIGGGRVAALLGGERVFGSPQIPTTRAKGSATDLTLCLVGIGSELMVGRAGGVDMKMTDSHGSNFSQGIFTLRATTYVDAVPRQTTAFGLIDQLANS